MHLDDDRHRRVIDTTRPADYLRSEPTDADARLAELCGTDTGAAVPFWMAARIASQAHGVSLWAAGKRRWETRIRRVALACVVALAGQLGLLATTMMRRAEDAGAAAERVAELSRRIDYLGSQITIIQQAMMRSSGIDPFAPSKPSSSGVQDLDRQSLGGDKMSLFRLPVVEDDLACRLERADR